MPWPGDAGAPFEKMPMVMATLHPTGEVGLAGSDELPQPDGSKLKRHLQFFALGSDKVRQFSQGSTDNGKTWNVEYDFTYIRKK